MWKKTNSTANTDGVEQTQDPEGRKFKTYKSTSRKTKTFMCGNWAQNGNWKKYL